MLFFGPAGLPAGCGSVPEGVERVAQLGLNALELEFVHGVRMGVGEARGIGALAKERGVLLSAHAPYYINLNSTTAEVRRRSRARILSTLKVASALGAKIIVVHAGYYSGRGSAESTARIAAELAECREASEKGGWGDVLIGLETMGRRSSWGTFDEIRTVARRVRGVVPVVDFAHMHARCGGCLGSTGDFERVLKAFEAFDAPFLHSHFTGVEWAASGERRHLELLKGGPDFALLAPALLRRRYDVTVICESPLLEMDSLLMKEMVEKARRDE
ncbi:MAG: TIM barrel protein [Thermoplasmatota archaeon]